MEARYQNPDDDPRGPWTSADLSARNPYSKGTYLDRDTVRPSLFRVRHRAHIGVYSEEKFKERVEDDRIWFGSDGFREHRRIKRFLSEVREGRVPQTLWKWEEVGHTRGSQKGASRAG